MIEAICDLCENVAVFGVRSVEGGLTYELKTYCGEHLHGGCKNMVFEKGSDEIVNFVCGNVYSDPTDAWASVNSKRNVLRKLEKLGDGEDWGSVLD